MQCVRCQHPLPPRADRCLRCFALNPQNRPEPLPSASPAIPLGAIPLGAIALKPLGLSFESDPPPKKDALGALSIRSDPPPKKLGANDGFPDLETPAPQVQTPPDRAHSEREDDQVRPTFIFQSDEPVFTPLEGPDVAFADPSLAEPPRLVIDLNAPRISPHAPDTLPSPPPSGMQLVPEAQSLALPTAPLSTWSAAPLGALPSWAPAPKPHVEAIAEPDRAPVLLRAPLSEGASARVTEPVLTPAPFIDLPPLSPPIVLPAAPSAAQRAPVNPPRSIDQLAQAALLMSDPGLPIDPSSSSPEPAGFEKQSMFAVVDPKPSLRARLIAWSVDGALIALISALFVALAALQLGASKLAPLGAQSWESWADGLLFAHRLPVLWALLCAALALGYSWLFAALGGRTPGARLAGLRLQREDGFPLDPLQALLRAALAIPSAALGLFGFVLALFDPRGQTLHDKLSRSLLVVSDAVRRES